MAGGSSGLETILLGGRSTQNNGPNTKYFSLWVNVSRSPFTLWSP